MKVSSPDLLHKSDLGLVEVGLTSAAEVKRAYNELIERAQKASKKAAIDGVIVTELVKGGIETVVGVSTDELFGPVIMFGLGGVFVEVFEDVTFRVPPFDKDEAHRMVREVKGFKLLEGARGQKPANVRGLVDVIMKVQKLALDHAGHPRRARHQPAARRAEARRRARRPRCTQMKDQTAIVGVGQTAFAKGLPQSEKQLALEAIVAALDDAGIDPGEVDGLSSYTLETTEEIEIARNLGTGDITYFSQVALRRRGRVRGGRPRRDGGGHRAVQGGRGVAVAQAGRRQRSSVGRRVEPHTGPPAMDATVGVCSDRSTRSPC